MRAATVLGAAMIAALAGFACERTGPSAGSEKTRPTGSEGRVLSDPANPPKPLNLSYDKTQHPKPVVGTNIDVTAEGLPANKTLNLVWGTVDGGWVIEDYFHFRGKKYAETERTLAQVTTGANGLLKTRSEERRVGKERRA